MTHAQHMLQINPSSAAVDAGTLVECMEACFDCAQSCTACADACLGEEDPKSLACCIRLDLDCADMCDATGRIFSRQTAFEPQMARAALQACAEACRLCGDECEHHASHYEHCRVCAEACRHLPAGLQRRPLCDPGLVLRGFLRAGTLAPRPFFMHQLTSEKAASM